MRRTILSFLIGAGMVVGTTAGVSAQATPGGAGQGAGAQTGSVLDAPGSSVPLILPINSQLPIVTPLELASVFGGPTFPTPGQSGAQMAPTGGQGGAP
ncbi:MAG: hypothetical protein ACKVVP_21955 [Chloroflexota bacterium]